MADATQPVNSQPQGITPMQMGNDRNAKNCPIGPDGKRDWSYGLLDCSDRSGLYCWSMWCPCVVYSKNRQRLRNLQDQGTPLFGDGERYDKQCCIFVRLRSLAFVGPSRCRVVLALKFVSAMAFVETRGRIALHRGGDYLDARRALILGCGRHSQFVFKEVRELGGYQYNSSTDHPRAPALLLVMAETKQPVSSQPQGIVPMQVGGGGGNRNAKNCPVDGDGKRDWSFSLWDCSDRGDLYCWSVWCPCVVYSKNKQRLRSLQNQGTPLPGGGERYDKECCIYGALTVIFLGWTRQVRTRTEIRERYGIRGDSSEDCTTSLCYQQLALIQERREIELEENSL
ncbi:PLAC8 family-domain-containing protein [Russula vinacea]|nr:PLAC8 family-domain-containing protein [Russula vinacea]